MARLLPILIVAAVIAATTYATMIPQVYPNGWHPKTYQVQIDEDPKKAWAHVVPDYDKELQVVAKVFDYLQVMTPEELHELGEQGKKWKAYPEIHRTVEALAELSGVPYDLMFFLQFAYEFSTYRKANQCTSLVVRNAQEQLWHGRNLDFEFWNLFGSLVANIEYYRGKEHLFNCVQFVGSVFCLTGIKPGKFAATIDTRHDEPWHDVLESLKKDGAPMSSYWLFLTLRDANTFEEAVTNLSTHQTSSPVYYIVSGVKPNQGAIIEKQIHGYHAIHRLNETNWYVVQTNYDHDKEEPFYDVRREPVEKHLNRMGNANFNANTMFTQVLDKWPTLNIGTVLSIVMQPSTGFFDLTLWAGGYERNRTRGNSTHAPLTPDQEQDFIVELADRIVAENTILALSEGNINRPSFQRMVKEFVAYPMGKWAMSPAQQKEEESEERQFLNW